MLKIFTGSSSSGTSGGFRVALPPEAPTVEVGVWNSAEVTFIDPSAKSEMRPLSAISELAVDLGQPDLSTAFRKRRSH